MCSGSTRVGTDATCNICVNGTSPLNRSHHCTGDEYVCDCEDDSRFPPKKVPCNDFVGRQNLSSFLGSGGMGRFCSLSHGPAQLTSCAVGTAADKLQGLWYSTLRSGRCGALNATGCTWRVVEVAKRVRRDCHSGSFFDAVEAVAPACFAGCGGKRNTSSPCWAGCVIDTTLGPQARHSCKDAHKGMTAAALAAAWSRPFDSDDPAKGGCPAV